MNFILRCLSAVLILAGSLLAQNKDISVSSASTLPILTNIHWRNTPVNWGVKDGVLTIQSAAATDWFTNPINGDPVKNSPVLLFPAAKDFSLSAKVTVDFRSQWDAGVLAIYANDSTWVKFCFEMSTAKQPTIVSVVTRGLSDDSNSVAIDGNSVYMKIAKSGQAIFLYTSQDGKKWTQVRAFSLGSEKDLPNLDLGFSSQSPTGSGTVATFSEIKYKPEPVANLFVGE